MANRRMFSVRITESTRFIKMPATSQNLYFHLGMRADDDGVVEAYPVLCTIGAKEDDLKVLVSKGFVTVLNEDLVSYVNDWKENNSIRADRKTDSIYKDLLVQILPGIELREAKESYYSRLKSICQTNDGQTSDNMQPNDSIGKDRIGKVSTGKVSTGKVSTGKDSISDICTVSADAAPNPSGILLPLNDKTFYNVPSEKIELWKETYPAVDINQELRRMIAWLDSNPTKKKTRKGIERFINNWLSRTQDNGGSKNQCKKSGLEEWING